MYKLITITDTQDSLYQLGLQEREYFHKIEKRINQLLSNNEVVSLFTQLTSRAKVILDLQKKSLFAEAIKSYCKGLDIHPSKYISFLFLIELSAQKNLFPDFKSLLPGCTSIFQKTTEGITHTRLLDFPLIDLFADGQRFYYWKIPGRKTVLSYSCPGLALLFIDGIHESGMSFALHHKTSVQINNAGKSIFEILFNSLLDARDLKHFKELIREEASFSKWGIYAVTAQGDVLACDLDHITFHKTTFSLNEDPTLFFTNISIHSNDDESFQFLKFTHSRQNWIKHRLKVKIKGHSLDHFTDLSEHKSKNWHHPAVTMATVGGYHANLSTGYVDFKVSQKGPITKSDPIYRLHLSNGHFEEIKKEGTPDQFEKAWKLAGLAQSSFDKKDDELGYHQLQMSRSLMPQSSWKNILEFFQISWEYKFVNNKKELSLIYEALKKLEVPEILADQKKLMIFRFEKRLGLMSTIRSEDLSIPIRNIYDVEAKANPLLFLSWAKNIAPRLEVLEVYSPHYLKDI